MEDASILANHDVAVVTVLHLQEISNKTVCSECVDEIALFGLVIKYFLEAFSLAFEFIYSDSIPHTFHYSSLMREGQNLIG